MAVKVPKWLKRIENSFRKISRVGGAFFARPNEDDSLSATGRHESAKAQVTDHKTKYVPSQAIQIVHPKAREDGYYYIRPEKPLSPPDKYIVKPMSPPRDVPGCALTDYENMQYRNTVTYDADFAKRQREQRKAELRRMNGNNTACGGLQFQFIRRSDYVKREVKPVNVVNSYNPGYSVSYVKRDKYENTTILQDRQAVLTELTKKDPILQKAPFLKHSEQGKKLELEAEIFEAFKANFILPLQYAKVDVIKIMRDLNEEVFTY